MYIARVKVSDFLRFRDKTNVDLSFARPNGKFEGWTVLAGRNGSGKTSLLRCIALGLVGPDVAARIAPAYPTWSRSEGNSEIKEDLYLDRYELRDLRVRLAGLPPERGAPASGICAAVEFRSRPVEVVPQEKGTYRVTLTGDWRADVTIDDGFEDAVHFKKQIGQWILPTRNSFVAGYGPFRRLSGDAQLQLTDLVDDDPAKILETADRFMTLFREDASLGATIPWLVGLHLRELEGERGAGSLLEGIIKLLSDGLLPEDTRVVRVDSRGLWVRHGTQTFALRDMSDGYRAVTALVIDIVRGIHAFYGRLNIHHTPTGVEIRSPGVVLVDEIDAHLHVSWQQRIGGWLKKHFPKIQFIVTTHSPYICQAADPGGLIRLPAPSEQSGPGHVSGELYQRIIYGSGDDAALSELFGLESPYSTQADQLRRELAELEEGIFKGEATKAQVNRYQTLGETLSSSPVARINEISAWLGRKD